MTSYQCIEIYFRWLKNCILELIFAVAYQCYIIVFEKINNLLCILVDNLVVIIKQWSSNIGRPELNMFRNKIYEKNSQHRVFACMVLAWDPHMGHNYATVQNWTFNSFTALSRNRGSIGRERKIAVEKGRPSTSGLITGVPPVKFCAGSSESDHSGT